ncbi:hypothetical protein BDV95DRAFT_668028 [Massariosphaeria phaeospora]|uniref:Uncharacterized protein n=1 Tax=Massariosphaeria phaeospora TaxID=100035 RepID=A0A7C8MEL1_9PLEO|nr:hypothetical protein BDV95DRAFT_668028 [Massariosphaeria phaeospora]
MTDDTKLSSEAPPATSPRLPPKKLNPLLASKEPTGPKLPGKDAGTYLVYGRDGESVQSSSLSSSIATPLQGSLPSPTTADSSSPGMASSETSIPTAQSTYAHKYQEALGDLDNPVVRFLRGVHGVPYPNSAKATVAAPVIDGHGSRIMGSNPPSKIEVSKAVEGQHFTDDWGAALGYRHRPTVPATEFAHMDPMIPVVLKKAERWIHVLSVNLLNTDDTDNPPDSKEQKMFLDPEQKLDKKAVEATCRAIFIALIHRCVVGFCGNPDHNYPRRPDRNLNCQERILAVCHVLKKDKRIARDVMQEDSKIVMLVHVPKGFADQKRKQKESNDARGKPTKSKKLGRPPKTTAGGTSKPTVSAPQTDDEDHDAGDRVVQDDRAAEPEQKAVDRSSTPSAAGCRSPSWETVSSKKRSRSDEDDSQERESSPDEPVVAESAKRRKVAARKTTKK